MKEISVTDKELAGLMDDLESMLAAETGTVAETLPVVAEFTTGLGTDKPAPVSMPLAA